MNGENKPRELLRRMRENPAPYACLAMVVLSLLLIAATLAAIWRA